jgi:hypothetical protein
MPGKKMRSVKRPRVYEALKSKLGKTRAAKIANSDPHTMGRKAGRTRKKRGH